ncbi:PREDICTED: dynactin, 150 kDa isoform-like [Nicotiana attenuata]|uniref:dynactin, 150 kDa isoform-like n=1 Tax=Nicotiana attenuata TaxID=49451 RepID=UPI0009057A92|nr:PREDICTED: dynactin, 150 kDa isoform-like [Nicotiana attenuata]
MAKTSKTVPKKDKASTSSTSQPAKPVVPPTLEEITPGPCVIKKDFSLGDASEMRPAPPGEKTKPSISKSGKDNKRKRVSKPEDPQDKKTPARKLRKRFAHADADSAYDSPDDEENDGEESALVPRTRKPIEDAKPSELEASSRGEGTLKKDAGKASVSPEVEIVPTPSTNMLEGANAETPEANENAPSDELGATTAGHSLSLPTYFEDAIEEANALRMPDPSKDIVKFRAELSQCEAELKKVSGEEKALRLPCNQKEEELKDLRAELAKAQKNEAELDEQLAADKEVVTAQLALAETQLRGIKAKGLAQVKKIEELEAELARARAEADKTKAAADKSIAIAEEKARETDARFLFSSDDEDVASGSGDGEGEEDVPEGEEAPEDRAAEGVVPEDGAPGDMTPKID